MCRLRVLYFSKKCCFLSKDFFLLNLSRKTLATPIVVVSSLQIPLKTDILKEKGVLKL